MQASPMKTGFESMSLFLTPEYITQEQINHGQLIKLTYNYNEVSSLLDKYIKSWRTVYYRNYGWDITDILHILFNGIKIAKIWARLQISEGNDIITIKLTNDGRRVMMRCIRCSLPVMP
jgi:hypothetical protein